MHLLALRHHALLQIDKLMESLIQILSINATK